MASDYRPVNHEELRKGTRQDSKLGKKGLESCKGDSYKKQKYRTSLYSIKQRVKREILARRLFTEAIKVSPYRSIKWTLRSLWSLKVKSDLRPSFKACLISITRLYLPSLFCSMTRLISVSYEASGQGVQPGTDGSLILLLFRLRALGGLLRARAIVSLSV